jgi:hypothetical protein
MWSNPMTQTTTEYIEGKRIRLLLNNFLQDIDTENKIDADVANAIVSVHLTKFRSFAHDLIAQVKAETAEDICSMIDLYESQAPSTLEQWREYKKIRNGIRDKYVLKRSRLQTMKEGV